jgi:predicted GIY-YIG superfamily endonuclease
MTGQPGVIYLLHFAQPYRHARHYTGWTEDLTGRLEAHASGKAARLTAVIFQAGIGFVLARTCEGTRATERAIKNAGGAVRYCPVCTPHPRNGRWGPLPAGLTPRYYPGRPADGPSFIFLPDLAGRR